MKKSLIALAVLAASGASFAQVTVTGNLTYGYQSTTTGSMPANAALGKAAVGSSESAGFGADNSTVTFTAKEDLGGGFAATAVLGLKTGAESPTVTNNGGSAVANDTKLTLVTPGGALVLGTMRDADYLSGGIAGVGAYYGGWDSKVLTARSNRDFFAFVIPVGAFQFAIGQKEAAGVTGLGGGTTGADASILPCTASGAYCATGSAQNGLGSKSPLTFVSATYAAGPIEANGMYLGYKNAAGVGNNKDTTRLSMSYDLGVAKLGAGAQISTLTGSGTLANPKVTDFLVAAKVPMGASSFGISWTSRQYTDFAGTAAAVLGIPAAFAGSNATPADGTANGLALEYGYAMSKRTSIIANYARWTPASSAILFGEDVSTQYQLLLSHSF